ncbi:uncharacterized protein LOC105664268 [Megachile rotundata]|uniref:uncharacterized protein LOC105664268 n=1 Tax=Megachile rotundata TaxID=143995 RepID=UPI0006152005|nr:PREDICTED: uncharacterized protein LOC105664268 [Megachile rotundata]
MIQATYKCGCPPKKEKPPCSPCCASKKVTIKSPTPSEVIPETPTFDELLQCCPIKPSDAYQRPSKIRSDIADRGLPYKEIEAIINNNRVVIRTQTEPGRPDYDPPCDCNEEGLPARQVAPDETEQQSSGNQTVTLYPAPPEEEKPDENNNSNKNSKKVVVEPVKPKENPNIFLLRMRKQSVMGDKRYNIDFEFKTPRPWSTKKRLEYIEQQAQLLQCTTVPATNKDVPERQSKASGKSRKKKRR